MYIVNTIKRLLSTYIAGILLVLNSPPKLKDLQNLITPKYAAYWKVIGTSLGFENGYLDAIEYAFPINNFWCCNKLLEKWLETNTTASWKKLIQVIDSPAVTALTANTTAAAAVDSQLGNYALLS